ncbi:thioredoxin family protein [Thermodesulfobacteriota bacterium]
MAAEDITQIKVDGQAVGIMGLKGVLEEMAKDHADEDDREIGQELLKRLSRKNYIPAQVKAKYAAAFLREFKKLMGRPYEDEGATGLEIKILGPGCAQCDGLEREIMEVLAELGLPGDVEHVTDVKEIGLYGVMGMPALIINGEVKAVGKVPPRNQIIAWLKENG